MSEKIEIIIGTKDKFSKTFGKLKSALPSLRTAALGASAAVGALGAGLFAITKSTAEAYDQVQKFSDQLGISTEFLSKMAHAAELSGIEQKTLHKSLQILTVRLGEANRGIGEGKDALESLGLEYKNVNGTLKTSEEILPDLAEAFKDIEDATLKAEIASKIFGQRGLVMLQLFKDGKTGLAEMSAEAEKFGLVISSKAGVNAAEFNDSLTRLKGSFRGLKNTIAEEIMPAFTNLANNMANFVANNRETIVVALRNFAISTFEMFKKMAIGIAGFGDSIKPIVQSIKGSLEGIWNAFTALPTWVQSVGIAGAFIGGKKGTVILLGSLHLLDAVKNSATGLGQAWAGNIKWAELATMNYDELSKKLKELKDQGLEPLGQELEKNIFRGKITMPAEIGFDDTNLRDQVAVFFSKFESMMTEASSTLSLGNLETSNGIHPFTSENLIKTEENMSAATEAFLLWRETEAETMNAFREDQFARDQQVIQDKVDANMNALALQQAGQIKFLGNMQSIAVTFGKKGFRVYQGLAATKATISAIQAFNVNLAEFPYPLGPILAASALALGLAQVAAIASQKPPSAHGGLTNVPKEQTYLLDKGERVVSPGQNKDLIEFMQSRAGGLSIDSLRVNISAPAPLEEMTESDWDIMIEENMIPSLKRLENWGIEI